MARTPRTSADPATGLAPAGDTLPRSRGIDVLARAMSKEYSEPWNSAVPQIETEYRRPESFGSHLPDPLPDPAERRRALGLPEVTP